MKDKILMIAIGILSVIVVVIGSYVALMPTVNPDNRGGNVVLEKLPENEMLPRLGIARQSKDKSIRRIMVVRNYEDKLDPDEINLIDRLRYYVLDRNAKGHILVLPYDIGGRITVTELEYSEYTETYVPSTKEDSVLIDEEITPGYALLLQYDRPSTNPEYQVKITQGEVTATYNINPADSSQMDEDEHIARDRVDESK